MTKIIKLAIITLVVNTGFVMQIASVETPPADVNEQIHLTTAQKISLVKRIIVYQTRKWMKELLENHGLALKIGGAITGVFAGGWITFYIFEVYINPNKEQKILIDAVDKICKIRDSNNQ